MTHRNDGKKLAAHAHTHTEVHTQGLARGRKWEIEYNKMTCAAHECNRPPRERDISHRTFLAHPSE